VGNAELVSAAVPEAVPAGAALPSGVGAAMAPPGVWPPFPAGVALPSVPAPPVLVLPPLSTELPAEMSSWRKGCTPNETPTMTAIPASATTGRIQPTPVRPSRRARPGRAEPERTLSESTEPEAVRGTLRIRGKGRSAAAGSACGHAQCQCPRQVQYRTRSAIPLRMLSSKARGGRLPVRARILVSPSALG
jgi:hypothetical protein